MGLGLVQRPLSHRSVVFVCKPTWSSSSVASNVQSMTLGVNSLLHLFWTFRAGSSHPVAFKDKWGQAKCGAHFTVSSAGPCAVHTPGSSRNATTASACRIRLLRVCVCVRLAALLSGSNVSAPFSIRHLVCPGISVRICQTNYVL